VDSFHNITHTVEKLQSKSETLTSRKSKKGLIK
jgi:hypothetical protein